MQRAGNLPECEAGPRPRADEAKPGACGHSTWMLCFWGPAREGGLGEGRQLLANRNIQIFSVNNLSAEPTPLAWNLRPP